MSKAETETTTKPERNEPLFNLLAEIGQDLHDLDQGIHTLILLGTCDDIQPGDVGWMGYRLSDLCDRLIAATEEATEKHIKPWRVAMGYDVPDAAVPEVSAEQGAEARP